MLIEENIAKTLINTEKTLAIGESCTGGLLANRLTNIPGSSGFLKFSVVAYSNEAKSRFLKVAPRMISRHGAVSSPVAAAMAQGARKVFNTDFGIGITGIAGPTGGTPSKPIGLTFIAVCTSLETLCLECHFKGTRNKIKTQAANQALQLLKEFLA